MANYCHLSYEGRKNIEDGLNDNISINQIAKDLISFILDSEIIDVNIKSDYFNKINILDSRTAK